jgi:hypothetical protein
VKVTLRWNEPVAANGEIEFYLLKINCSQTGEQQHHHQQQLQQQQQHQPTKTTCHENVFLKAREREFVFKEDPKDNQVIFSCFCWM